MTKFFTKITRKSGRYLVTVFSHEIDVAAGYTADGYPIVKDSQRQIEVREFHTKQAALEWAVKQPSAREMAA